MNARYPGALRRQPAARRAAGALLAGTTKTASTSVLFLNGIPVATVELKTDFTQSVGDAIDQYRFDRHPKPKGRHAGAAAELSQRRAGPFRREQQRSAYDDAAGRAGDASSCPSTRATTAARATRRTRRRSPHSYLWEEVWAARQLAGDPRPLPGHPAGREEADQRASSSRAITSSTPRGSCWRRVLAEGAGGQVS